MYYIYNTNSETRHGWRNAYEVRMAALEHEKRRFQTDEEISLAKPQVPTRAQQRPGWASALRSSLLLLSVLIK